MGVVSVIELLRLLMEVPRAVMAVPRALYEVKAYMKRCGVVMITLGLGKSMR